MDYRLELVPVPVSDVDRAKTFYAEKVGVNVDHDVNASTDHRVSDEMRIVQLTPPGSACSIVIGSGMDGGATGTVQLQLVVSDIVAARAELLARDVEISEVQHFEGAERVDGPGGDWNSFAFFTDPDGHGWALQQSPARD